VVVLNYVLADEVNVGYHDVENEIVSKVNGEEVKDLKDLVTKIESSKGVRRDRDRSWRQVRAQDPDATAANPRIMTRYRIGADRSDDLK